MCTSENNYVKNIIAPNTQPKTDFDILHQPYHDIRDIINNENKTCLIMDDFNIDLLECNSQNETNDCCGIYFWHGFLPQILKPTIITQPTATLIDHFYLIIINDVTDQFGIFHIYQIHVQI